jgi:hypothetical protein
MEELRKPRKTFFMDSWCPEIQFKHPLKSSLEHFKSRLSAAFELSVPGYRINV